MNAPEMAKVIKYAHYASLASGSSAKGHGNGISVGTDIHSKAHVCIDWGSPAHRESASGGTCIWLLTTLKGMKNEVTEGKSKKEKLEGALQTAKPVAKQVILASTTFGGLADLGGAGETMRSAGKAGLEAQLQQASGTDTEFLYFEAIAASSGRWSAAGFAAISDQVPPGFHDGRILGGPTVGVYVSMLVFKNRNNFLAAQEALGRLNGRTESHNWVELRAHAGGISGSKRVFLVFPLTKTGWEVYPIDQTSVFNALQVDLDNDAQRERTRTQERKKIEERDQDFLDCTDEALDKAWAKQNAGGLVPYVDPVPLGPFDQFIKQNTNAIISTANNTASNSSWFARQYRRFK